MWMRRSVLTGEAAWHSAERKAEIVLADQQLRRRAWPPSSGAKAPAHQPASSAGPHRRLAHHARRSAAARTVARMEALVDRRHHCTATSSGRKRLAPRTQEKGSRCASVSKVHDLVERMHAGVGAPGAHHEPAQRGKARAQPPADPARCCPPAGSASPGGAAAVADAEGNPHVGRLRRAVAGAEAPGPQPSCSSMPWALTSASPRPWTRLPAAGRARLPCRRSGGTPRPVRAWRQRIRRVVFVEARQPGLAEARRPDSALGGRRGAGRARSPPGGRSRSSAMPPRSNSTAGAGAGGRGHAAQIGQRQIGTAGVEVQRVASVAAAAAGRWRFRNRGHRSSPPPMSRSRSTPSSAPGACRAPRRRRLRRRRQHRSCGMVLAPSGSTIWPEAGHRPRAHRRAGRAGSPGRSGRPSSWALAQSSPLPLASAE